MSKTGKCFHDDERVIGVGEGAYLDHSPRSQYAAAPHSHETLEKSTISYLSSQQSPMYPTVEVYIHYFTGNTIYLQGST